MTFALAVDCSVDLDCDSLREIFDVDKRGRKKWGRFEAESGLAPPS